VGQEPEDAKGGLVGPGDLAIEAAKITIYNPAYLIDVDAIAVIDEGQAGGVARSTNTVAAPRSSKQRFTVRPTARVR
jgi:hypothetical protein